jgi:predicted peroxiredoxin
MIHRLREPIAFAAILLVCGLVSPLARGQQQSKARDGVFVHITHGAENPHRLLMGLQMAVTMAEGGQDVLVYCDIEAVRALTTTAKPVVFKPFKSSHELLNRLKELNVAVLACPTCMKAAHIDPAALRPGVSVAQKDLLFAFTKGRILSLDY